MSRRDDDLNKVGEIAIEGVKNSWMKLRWSRRMRKTRTSANIDSEPLTEKGRRNLSTHWMPKVGRYGRCGWQSRQNRQKEPWPHRGEIIATTSPVCLSSAGFKLAVAIFLGKPP